MGEESTEVIVAAKNNNAELQYETADLLYHLMVVLVEKGVSFDDVKRELASREGLMSKTKDRANIEKL